MCGIVGIIKSDEISAMEIKQLNAANERLSRRGPDHAGIEAFKKVAFAHRRLSIIDTSAAANQPFKDESGRFTLVFNGEIYNFKLLKQKLEEAGYAFRSHSDTEVLLKAYMHFGTAFLNHLDGFFALAIYDQETEETLLARDRFGIKPLLYSKTENRLLFGSELKALMCFEINKEIDNSSLFSYLQLNYIPEPHSIFKSVKKLEAGHYLKIDKENRIQKIPFYQLKYPPEDGRYTELSYDEAQQKFLKLMDASVEQRLVSDVPLGTFLSGGIDSSIITALAAQKVDKLNTFSIGFENEPIFDESPYALMLAKKYKTNHHTFLLTKKDLLESLHESLEYIDEPFADSSALAVNALSKETAKHVKVALSGDGADELFAGYYKHRGEFMMRKSGIKQNMVKKMQPIWEALPKSRNSKVGNLIRKLHKFSKGSSMSTSQRYWLWASLMQEQDAANLMLKQAQADVYLKRKEQLLELLHDSNDLNDVLATDMRMVLPSDMLRKVDLMSMRNSLEVRTPFLDHRIVNFAFTLPESYKINEKMGKRLVQDATKHLLPDELFNRPKHGFEVPLLPWFRKELKSLIVDDLLEDNFIKEQNIFNLSYIQNLKNKLFSSNPEDAQANIWAIIVFNSWWKKYIS